MTQTSVMDTAGFFSERREPVVAQSDWHDGVLLTRDVNSVARDVRTFALAWRPANHFQRRDVRAHYTDNANKPFDLNLPNGTLARVIYRSAPVFRVVSATAVEIAVELEEAYVES